MAAGRPGTDPTAGPDPIAIKLADTVGWRFDPERRIERLPDGAALVAWAHAVGLLDPAEAAAVAAAGAEALDAEAARARGLRDDLYAVLDAHVAGEPSPAPALAGVQAAYTDAVSHARPRAVLPLTWDVPALDERAAGRRLALAAADLLTSADLPRVGRCENPPCGWLFVDRTRSRTRRWCTSEGCGNRDRAKRHYA